MKKTEEQLISFLSIDETMGFNLGDLNGESKKLLDTLLKKKFNLGEKSRKSYYWNAEAYGLDRTTCFKTSTEEEKNSILKALNDIRFMEALSIEKAGIHYHSKMILLSDKLDEKSFYAAFVNDEMKHFHSLLQYCPIETPESYISSNPFLRLINQGIQHGDRDCMIAFLQNILEGVGMSYYRGLKETCNDDSLRSDIDELLKDEAFHVGSGNILLEKKTYDPSKPLLRELILQFAGDHPGWIAPVLISFEMVKQGLTRNQKIQLLEELNYGEINAQKTLELRKIMLSPFTQSIIDEADRMNLFKAISAHEFMEKF